MPTILAGGQNAYVSFTDGQGSAQLTTTQGMFNNWVPDSMDVGTDDVAMGSGLTYKFIYRTDYYATFDIVAIPEISMPIALRLRRWLEAGGQITIATQDLQGNTYTAYVWPKKKVTFRYDPQFQEYTMTVPVLNSQAAPMLCLYSPTLGTNYTIKVTPSSLSLGGSVGSQTQLTATIYDPNNNVVTGIPVSWSSTNNSIASVSVTGLVTANATGNCAIIASIGSVSAIVPCAVSVTNLPAVVTLTGTAGLTFTPGDTYVGTPVLIAGSNPAKYTSGVPTVTVTATMTNAAGQTIAYTAGSLTWTVTGSGATIVDNQNGTCTVTAIAGGQSGAVTATVTNSIGTNNVVSGSANYTTQAGQPATLVPSSSSVTLTGPSTTANVSVVTVDPYGTVVP